MKKGLIIGLILISMILVSGISGCPSEKSLPKNFTISLIYNNFSGQSILSRSYTLVSFEGNKIVEARTTFDSLEKDNLGKCSGNFDSNSSVWVIESNNKFGNDCMAIMPKSRAELGEAISNKRFIYINREYRFIEGYMDECKMDNICWKVLGNKTLSQLEQEPIPFESDRIIR